MIRCTVYDGEDELFYEEGTDRLVVAGEASERARLEYPSLQNVSWQFETIYPPVKPYVPVNRLDLWDEFVRTYRAQLEANE